MGLKPSQLQAVLSLLEEEDETILVAMRRKLFDLGRNTVEAVQQAAPEGSRSRRETERVLARFREPSIESRFRELQAGGKPDLEAGVFAIARLGCPDLPAGSISARLDRMAMELAPDVAPDDHPVRVIRSFSHYLFGTCGFEAAANYIGRPDPDDSYLNKVLDRRRGLPISLAALYILLGRRVGVPFEGVNTPSHFLAKLAIGETTDIIVDPFHRGRILTRNECADVVGRAVTDQDLAPVPDRYILVRMLTNLVGANRGLGRHRDAEKVIRLIHILTSTSDP